MGHMAERAVTITDVARKAGVSPSLVSLVFNKRPNVSPAAASLVREAAETLGYHPLPGARRRGPKPGLKRKMEAGGGFTICLLSANAGNSWHSPVYADVAHGVEKAASASGCHLRVKNIPDLGAVTEELESLADGIVFLSGNAALKALLAELNLPAIEVMGAPDQFNRFDHVTYDNSMIGRIAARHLLDKGHRHCAVISNKGTLMAQRAADFQAELAGAGGEADCHWLEGGSDEMARAVGRLLERRPLPTALFSVADGLTVQLYQALYQRGVIPGKDLEIVSTNKEVLVLRDLQPKPATVDIKTEEVGRCAVERLLWRRACPTASRVKMLISPELAGPENY